MIWCREREGMDDDPQVHSVVTWILMQNDCHHLVQPWRLKVRWRHHFDSINNINTIQRIWKREKHLKTGETPISPLVSLSCTTQYVYRLCIKKWAFARKSNIPRYVFHIYDAMVDQEWWIAFLSFPLWHVTGLLWVSTNLEGWRLDEMRHHVDRIWDTISSRKKELEYN